MTSMRKLRRRHLRWRRYVDRIWPRGAKPLTVAYPPGWSRSDSAIRRLRERRQPPALVCLDCGLVDSYNGQGDGIGSCDCPRCQWCGAPPLECCCGHDDWADEYDDECDVRVEDELGFQRAGLL